MRLACAAALIGVLLGESVGAQSTVAIAGVGPTTAPATTSADHAAADGVLLEYRRDETANNPLRTAADPAGYGAAIPAAATVASPEELAAQARAAAAFAPAEPPVSHDAPATPLAVAQPFAGVPSPASPPMASVPLPSAALPSAPASTGPSPAASSAPAPPVAAADDDDAGPIYRYDAREDGEIAASQAAAPSFTLPASAAEAIAPSAVVDANAAAARRLAPQAGADRDSSGYRAGAATKSTLVPTAFGQLKSLASAGGALLVVVALFVACALLLRRGAPKPTGMLPPEAFAVLGRAPLTAQSFAQLLRLGNKLVLVAVTADGAQPLAEVNDPAEVDRIAGLCVSGHGAGPSAEFQQVLAQLAREPAKGFLGREGSSARRRA